MMITLIKGDITRERVDVIVTAANAQLAGGGGVDGAVHRAAGPELIRSLRNFNGCPTGQAVLTPAFDLTKLGVRYIVHAVGPIYQDGKHGEPAALASAYEHSMRLVADNGCTSVAFPAISAGVYGYPLEQAAVVAIKAVRRALERTPEIDVRFVLFSDEVLDAFRAAVASNGP